MKRLVCRAAIIVALLPLATPAGAETVTGPARVIDGDTIEVAGERVRLWGLDTPEMRQHCERHGAEYACGEAARDALVDMIASHDVRCEGRGRGYYGRLLGVCWVGSVNLNQRLVATGWAVIDPRYPSDYHAEQHDAEQTGVGVWAGTFDPPWKWRRSKR